MSILKPLSIEILKESQSEATLKSLVRKANKEEVIDYALNYINDYDLIGVENIKLESFLSEVYDKILSVSRINYAKVSELEEKQCGETMMYSKNCLLKVQPYPGGNHGFNEFASIILIAKNVDITDSFLVLTEYNQDHLLPLAFYINTPIDKRDLNLDNVELITKHLLQLAYIKKNYEKNSNYEIS